MNKPVVTEQQKASFLIILLQPSYNTSPVTNIKHGTSVLII